MKRIFHTMLALVLAVAAARAADPMATNFDYTECEGSLMPYQFEGRRAAYPDTLVPVMINHVGRHGARYPASATNCKNLRQLLLQAKERGTITTLGKKLLDVTDLTIELSDNRWGALDSVGEREQRLIASHMYADFKPVFAEGCKVNAISSYSPRCMMSMYVFTHQLDRLDNHIEFTTSTGRANSALMRPFDVDADYREFVESGKAKEVYDKFMAENCPVSALRRVVGNSFEFDDDEQAREMALAEYYVLAGLEAMGVECDLSQYFTKAEINALWGCFNLRQYLNRTATTLSTVPADIASKLLLDLVNTTDDFIAGRISTSVILRFGHAETLMPLLSLMHLPGCYYMTNYFDTVAKNWQDFNVVPMAANLQMILFRNPKSERYYLRVDLNEKPVKMIPNSDAVYIPWATARRYLMRCVTFYAQ